MRALGLAIIALASAAFAAAAPAHDHRSPPDNDVPAVVTQAPQDSPYKGYYQLVKARLFAPATPPCGPGAYLVKFDREPLQGSGHVAGTAFYEGHPSEAIDVDGDTSTARVYVYSDDLPDEWITGAYAEPCQ